MIWALLCPCRPDLGADLADNLARDFTISSWRPAELYAWMTTSPLFFCYQVGPVAGFKDSMLSCRCLIS